MTHHRSPLKARTMNVSVGSLRKTVTKRQNKRKLSEMFAFNTSEEPNVKRLFNNFEESLDNSLDEFNGNFFQPVKRSTSPIKTVSSALPIDLRIGSKIRVSSNKPFAFSPISASNNNNGDENNNTDSSCGQPIQFDCATNKDARRLVNNTEEMQNIVFKNVRPLVLLKAAGLFYQYPDGRYGQMFSKGDRLSRSKSVLSVLPTFGKDDLDFMHREWLETFEDLYASWKAGLRSSFYFISTTFTILFLRTCSLNESDETCMGLNWDYRVIITPTTSGFRAMLKKKGITFALPFNSKQNHQKENETSGSYASTNNSFYDCSSLDVSSNSLGTSRREGTPEQENIPLFEVPAEEFVSPVKPCEVVELDELLRNIGSSPSIKVSISESQDQMAVRESNVGTTVLITEMDSVNLFHGLIVSSSKLGWEKSGPNAGLPPTLFASDQFSNSSLRSLNFKTQVLKRTNNIEYTLVMDDGPILPHVPRMLHAYFQSGLNSLNTTQTFKFNITGRSSFGGLNEAAGDAYKNISDFEVSVDDARSRFTF